VKSARDPEAFVRAGLRRREFFPHEVVWLPKAYPDTYLKLAARGVDRTRALAGRCVQVNVYSDRLEGLPPALFTDPAVNWHGQQYGRTGLIAAAGLFLEDRSAFVTLLQSDLCQQIYRSPELKRVASARLNNRFRYWHLILLNAVLDFACDHGIETVYSPTAAHILATTAKRIVPDLFVAIYDAAAERYACRTERVGDADYWLIPVAPNRDRVVRLPAGADGARDTPAPRKFICVCHDIEEDVDTEISAGECREALARMLEVERAAGVPATYNVLGRLFRDSAPVIAAGGSHALAFHSFDHRIDDRTQLPRVREVDLQVKGYRPPQSVITEEISDYALAYWNFEWLLSSTYSLGIAAPALENGIVKIPVHLDDYSLHTGELSRSAWLERLFAEVEARDFVAVGLHDCYARQWLEWYPELLARLQGAGSLRTCEQVQQGVLAASALQPPSARPCAK
jgi:hypothetical protein